QEHPSPKPLRRAVGLLQRRPAPQPHPQPQADVRAPHRFHVPARLLHAARQAPLDPRPGPRRRRIHPHRPLRSRHPHPPGPLRPPPLQYDPVSSPPTTSPPAYPAPPPKPHIAPPPRLAAASIQIAGAPPRSPAPSELRP